MLLVSDIPNAIISGVLINAGELLLALALLAAERRFVDAPLPQLAEARAG